MSSIILVFIGNAVEKNRVQQFLIELYKMRKQLPQGCGTVVRKSFCNHLTPHRFSRFNDFQGHVVGYTWGIPKQCHRGRVPTALTFIDSQVEFIQPLGLLTIRGPEHLAGGFLFRHILHAWVMPLQWSVNDKLRST